MSDISWLLNATQEHLTFRQFSQVASLDIIISLQEYFSESGFANRVIFQVKFVESME